MEPRDYTGIKLWEINPIVVDAEPPRELTPYQKLFLAILMDAIETLKKPPTGPTGPRYVGQRKYHTRHEKQIKIDPIADAMAWIMSDEEDWCLAFVAICQHFKWNHCWIRKKALEAINKAREQGGGRRNRVATDGTRRRKRA